MAFSAGGSVTTSQCSKSQPSSNIVSLGGRFDQFELLSLREVCDGRVAKVRKAPDEEAGDREAPHSAIEEARRREKCARERAEEVVVAAEKGRERRNEAMVCLVVVVKRVRETERIRGAAIDEGLEKTLEERESVEMEMVIESE